LRAAPSFWDSITTTASKRFVTRTNRARHLAAVIIAVALTLGFTAIATLGAEINGTGDGIFTRMGDYLAAMTEALGGSG
jgi:hypothetical protein